MNDNFKLGGVIILFVFCGVITLVTQCYKDKIQSDFQREIEGTFPKGSSQGGMKSDSSTESVDSSEVSLPTQKEIAEVQAGLPMQMNEMMELFEVSYSNKVLLWKGRFLDDIEEYKMQDMKTPEYALYIKSLMLATMVRDRDRMYYRVKAGMTFRSIYYSKQYEKLYQVDITSDDLVQKP